MKIAEDFGRLVIKGELTNIQLEELNNFLLTERYNSNFLFVFSYFFTFKSTERKPIKFPICITLQNIYP